MPGTAAPKTFLDNRDGHLKKSAAFRVAAKNRLADNLAYRTALSDAVESIRHSLQAFLWTRISVQFPREPAGRWQEVAAKGSMPELLAAAAEGGLTLPSQQQQDIMKLVRARNSYTHDSPQSGMLITREVAEKAVGIAFEVDRRTQGGKAGPTASDAPVAPKPLEARADGTKPPQLVGPAVKPGSPATAPRDNVQQLNGPPTTPNTIVPTSTPDATAPPESATEEDPDGDMPPDALPVIGRGRRRLWVALGVAAALVLGLLAGTAITYPVASGQAALPGWVPFARLLAPATPTAALPTATGTPYTGPLVAGNLVVTPSACGAAQPTVTLRNTGAATVTWAAGSPDALGATFSESGTGTPHATLTGQLAPNASTTLIASGLPSGGAHVVVIADGGTVELALPVC